MGLKPTVGLTSTVGVISESPSMDTVGPFGRSVEDATIGLDIIHERRATSDAHDDRLVSTPAYNFWTLHILAEQEGCSKRSEVWHTTEKSVGKSEQKCRKGVGVRFSDGARYQQHWSDVWNRHHSNRI